MERRNFEHSFLDFLQEDLALSRSEIVVALRGCQTSRGPLPMVLWQYGLISLEQLAQIFDWLENCFGFLDRSVLLAIAEGPPEASSA